VQIAMGLLHPFKVLLPLLPLVLLLLLGGIGSTQQLVCWLLQLHAVPPAEPSVMPAEPPAVPAVQVLLLDEITVDLDVLGRADLMDFLKQECRTRGATIIYVSRCWAGGPPGCCCGGAGGCCCCW
jgi:hypothetical protein